MNPHQVHSLQKELAGDPDQFDLLAHRLRERSAPVHDYLSNLAYTLVRMADEYETILSELNTILSAERIEEIRSIGSTVGVDLTARLREIHRAQEDPDSHSYLQEITPAERLLGRLAQSYTLLLGLGYRPHIESLLVDGHELRQLLGEPATAQWLIDYTGRDSLESNLVAQK